MVKKIYIAKNRLSKNMMEKRRAIKNWDLSKNC